MEAKWKWVCRDDDGWYVICPLQSIKPVKSEDTWVQKDRKGVERHRVLNALRFEFLFPKFKLKPGEGPRRVKFTAEFVD